jgi:hypothetical protein
VSIQLKGVSFAMSRNLSLALDIVYYGALFHFIVIELLFAVIGFLGFLDITVIASVTMLILQILAFVVSLVMWIVVIRCFGKYFVPTDSLLGGKDLQERGMSAFRSSSVYFLITAIIHAIFIIAWVSWQTKYGDLAPLDFKKNFGPFIIKLILLACQFLIFFIALFYFISDIRHQSLSNSMRSLLRAKTPASVESQSTEGR